jgi:hypothetical protein
MLSPRIQIALLMLLSIASALIVGGEYWGP